MTNVRHLRARYRKILRFASRYIDLDETPEEPESNVGYNVPYVDRPTPKERWIDNRDSYAG